MWLTVFLLICLGVAVYFLMPGLKAFKNSMKTVEKMKSTSDTMTAQMNDIKAQQQLLQEKKEYLRYDIHQKKNSFVAVKDAFSSWKDTIHRIKN